MSSGPLGGTASGVAPTPVWRIGVGAIQDACLIGVTGLFAYFHIQRVLVDGVYTAAPFALINLTYAFLFLTRRHSRATSTRWQDWLVAAIGGWLAFASRPEDPPSDFLAVSGTVVQAVGLILAVVCLTSLGRSFGIVAANRGLKTGGAYAFVRHPIYSAHLLTQAGFLAANPSIFNATILAIVAAAQVLRIGAEERLLEASSDYASYKQAVRYRLLPGVY